MGWMYWVQGVVENKDETDHKTWQQEILEIFERTVSFMGTCLYLLSAVQRLRREFNRTLVSRRKSTTSDARGKQSLS